MRFWYSVPSRAMCRRMAASAGVGVSAIVLYGALKEPAAMYSRRKALADANGKKPEFGSERAGRWRADWACIGANVATEDRMVVQKVGQDGVLCCVFDGHYGPRAAEFCKNNVLNYVNTSRDGNDAPEASMTRVFQMLESGWIRMANSMVDKGDWTSSLEGACALVAHVSPTHLTVGNLGDCRAVLFQEEGGELTAVQLTQEHNASNPDERSRIQGEHPGEDDAVQFVDASGSWYVKGTLQVSRAIGDLFLKDRTFHSALPDHVRPFVGGELKTPPYVSIRPDVIERKLEEKDLFLVLASDGLWDELTNEQCAAAMTAMGAAVGLAKRSKAASGSWVDELGRGGETRQEREAAESIDEMLREEGELTHPSSRLLWTALRENPVAQRFGLQFVLNIEQGAGRRQVHDDISIVVLWLRPPPQ
mmetsp:Transcript_64536/g.153929  ORF Transcript_64536/g.153929 Transcript_64536/m.153929 type:complete len:420 (+) Transcript_64536:90-1349(+)